MNLAKLKGLMLGTSGKDKPMLKKKLLSTGSTQLNLALSGKRKGGIEEGTVVLLAGDSDSGKTYIARTILAEAANNPAFADYALKYSDAERGWLGDDILHFGKKLSQRLETDYPESLDEFYYTVDDDIQTGKPFIRVLDSMDALQPKDDLKKFRKQKKASREDKEEKGTYGMAKAKMNSDKLRVVSDQLARIGSILIIIAQLKDNVASPIPGQKSVSGGKALKFYSHLVVWTGTKTVLTKEYTKGRKLDQGIQVIAKVKRSRLTGKKRSVTFPIYHTAGIDDVGACIDFLVTEGYWKKSARGIHAEEFIPEQAMRREELVKYIESENGEEQLQVLVANLWNKIEDSVKVERKRRYE